MIKEERIVITIDADGAMTAKTSGIKGERCIEELEALLSELAELDEIQHTREFKEKDAPVKHTSRQQQRLGGGTK